jgi:hypothetical protein
MDVAGKITKPWTHGAVAGGMVWGMQRSLESRSHAWAPQVYTPWLTEWTSCAWTYMSIGLLPLKPNSDDSLQWRKLMATKYFFMVSYFHGWPKINTWVWLIRTLLPAFDMLQYSSLKAQIWVCFLYAFWRTRWPISWFLYLQNGKNN